MDSHRTNLNLLPVLAALLQEQSISGAARRLGRSQPALSMALSQLRELFDDPLLVRSGRRMVLTRKAASLQPRVEALVGELSVLLGAGESAAPLNLRVTIP